MLIRCQFSLRWSITHPDTSIDILEKKKKKKKKIIDVGHGD